MERDYLALDKRYPRLFVPSEFSKVIVNWPKQKLTLSLHTSVSFEHDYTHEDGGVDVRYTPTKSLAVKTRGKTVWNAKMILMSGLSRTARDDLASDKPFEDRIPHMCNILKFAVLKKDHSFMATGGPWDSTDGVNPSVDQSSLIKTMLRHTNDKLHLDLSNCRHWSPFLEIHYDRVGTDGVSGFKEITVLFVPDLSECLPSFDAWRTQWLAHKKALAERDRLLFKRLRKMSVWERVVMMRMQRKRPQETLLRRPIRKTTQRLSLRAKRLMRKRQKKKLRRKREVGKMSPEYNLSLRNILGLDLFYNLNRTKILNNCVHFRSPWTRSWITLTRTLMSHHSRFHCLRNRCLRCYSIKWLLVS